MKLRLRVSLHVLVLLLACLYNDKCLTYALTREAFPCEISQEHFEVSAYSRDTVNVPANLTFCGGDYSWNAEHNGFRITTRILESAAGLDNISKPVVFVARQPDSDGIVYWEAPLDLQLNGTSVSQQYLSISHTMCPFKYEDESTSLDKNLSSPLPLFSIDVFTHSEKTIHYSISVEPVNNFVISDINGSYITTVTPPSPQVFYYKIPDEHEIITIDVKNISEAVGCLFVSVQNNTCPFNDLLLDNGGGGIYQTMTKSAFLTVETKWLEQREFLLVLVSANYSICHDPPFNNTALSSFLAHGQTVNITIGKLQPTKDYLAAIWFPVLITLAIMFLSSLAVGCCYTTLCESGCVPIQCIKTRASNCYQCVPCYFEGASKCICCVLDSRRRTDTFDTSSCKPCGPCVCVCFSGCKRNLEEGDDGGVRVCMPCGDESDSDGEEISERSALVASTKRKESSSLEDSGVERVKINDNKPLNDRRRYLAYGWNTIIVGIFYALPAFQLIFFQQKLLDQSGNQDMCYYNFMCAHPARPISAFNNVWSNICYVLLGLCFCGIVLYRHRQYKNKLNNQDTKKYLETHGIQQYFGICYALGIALVLEGFMSSFYHICPSNANFQFDTAFMFIIGGLLLVKMYQNRHPDVNASAFVAFFCFALIIFFTVVGIYNDRDHPLVVKITFVLFIVIIILPFILISFYTIKLNKRKLMNKMKEGTKCGEIKHQIYKWYTLRHVVVLLFNVGMGVYMTVKYRDTGIATVVLTFIVVNVVLYLVLYFLSKVLNREPLTLLAMLLPFLIGLSWIGAFIFYGTVTKWEKPPAESRAMNEKCVLLKFYDKHDVWHMLSACGMFFAFLFVLVLDDGVADWETKKLKKF